MNFTQFVDRFPVKAKRCYFFCGQNFFVNEGVQMVKDYIRPDLDFDFQRLFSPTESAVIDSLRIQAVVGPRLIVADSPKEFEQWQQAPEWLHKMPSDVNIVFTHTEDVLTTNPFVQEIIKKGFFVSCRELDEYEGELFQWIQKELEPCDEGAVNEIIQLLGSNYARIRQEIRKLRIVTEGLLTAQNVTKLLGLPEPRDVFNLMENLGARNKELALETCLRIEESASALGFVGLLEHRFRQLAYLHYLRAGGVEDRDIVIRLKIHRFYISQVLALSRQFSPQHCRQALKMLETMDHQLRRGADFAVVIPKFIVQFLEYA